MKLPFRRAKEKKASAVQYVNGVYILGGSSAGNQRLTNYVQGYRLCDTIYSCVNLIVQSAALVPWYVYREQADGEPVELDRHILADWMDNPGPGMDWSEFVTRIGTFYHSTGNVYLKKNVGGFGLRGKVEVLRPQAMTIKLTKIDGDVLRYEYRVGGIVDYYKPEDIVHLKMFNPEESPNSYGLSPIQVLARKVDIIHFGELWTLALLENDARPSGALVAENKVLTPEQREVLQEQFTQRYGGYENAGKPLVLEGGLKWEPFAITPKEMEFLNSRKVTMREICAAFKVPPELLGDNENKTYSNIKEARKALYQEAVLPFLGRVKGALNREVVPLFDSRGAYLDYDVSGIDALSEDLNALWARGIQAYQAGTITRNEFRAEIGYGDLEGVPDMIADPISLMTTPVAEIGKPKPEPETVPEEPQDEPEDEPSVDEGGKPKKAAMGLKSAKDGGFWVKPERKEAKWNAFHRRILARQRPIEAIAKKYLGEQADHIRKNVKGVPLSQINRWGILDVSQEAERFVDASIKWYIDSFTKGVRAGMAAGKGEISDGEEKGWTWQPGYEQIIRDMIVKSGTKIAETTMEYVMHTLDLAEAMNWTVDEFARAIREQLDTQEPWRAKRIAVTEAAKVENFGELQGYKETEYVELKGWLCAFVELSRQAHKDADARYSEEPIALDEPFDVGGDKMMHPLDGSLGAGPGQIINCYCTMFPRVKEI